MPHDRSRLQQQAAPESSTKTTNHRVTDAGASRQTSALDTVVDGHEAVVLRDEPEVIPTRHGLSLLVYRKPTPASAVEWDSL